MDGLKDLCSHLLTTLLPLLSFIFLPSLSNLRLYHSLFCAPLYYPCLLLSFSLSSPHPDMSGPHGSVSIDGLYRHHRQRGGHEVHQGGR